MGSGTSLALEYILSVASTASPADQVASAKALLGSDSITQTEFEQLKAKACLHERRGWCHSMQK